MSTDTKPAQQPVSMPVTITGQYVKDFSFENPNAPQIFAPSANAPEITMGVNINTRNVDAKTHEVILVLKIEAKLQTKTAFISELAYAGLFGVPDMQEEQLRMFLLVEAPRMLFPFARSILTSAIREGGFPYINVNPIDFYSLYLANKDKVGSMPTVGAA